MTIDELKARTTISLWPEAAQVLSISKNSAYAAAKAGEIPVVKLGARFRVPVPALLAMLGVTDA